MDFTERFNPKIAERLKEYTATLGFSAHLGIQVESAAAGTLTCTLAVKPEHLSGIGVVHGGVIASLIDHTLSLTVYPLVEAGKWCATLEFKVNYLGSVKEGVLRATGHVQSLRRTLSVVRVDVVNDSELVAVGQGTIYVRDRT